MPLLQVPKDTTTRTRGRDFPSHHMALEHHAKQLSDKKTFEVSKPHQLKFSFLLCKHRIQTGLTNNRNEIITNLKDDTITREEESILQFGLKYGLATRPKESDIIATAELIWDQLDQEKLLPDGHGKQE